MKKANIFLILFLLLFCVFFAQQKKYVFDETQLTKDKFILISERDTYCSYEIKNGFQKI